MSIENKQKYLEIRNQFLPKSEQDSEGYVYYLGFGSNMNDNTFKNRRKVKPIESFPCFIKNWQLSFDLYILPFQEPAMGNIQYIEGCELHGVLHRVTYDDFVQIQNTEGGVEGGYYLVKLEVEDYGNKKYNAWALKAKEERTINKSRFGMLPSLRYLNIIRQGARDYKLKSEYLAFLDKLEHQRRNCFSITFQIFIILLLLPFLIIGALIFLCHKKTGQKIIQCLGSVIHFFYNLFSACCADVNKGIDCSIQKFIPQSKQPEQSEQRKSQ